MKLGRIYGIGERDLRLSKEVECDKCHGSGHVR